MVYRNYALVLFVLLSSLLATSCPKAPQQPGGPAGGMTGPPPVAVVLEPVVEIDYAPAIELVGEVRATQQAILASEVAGRVISITHRVGEAHKKSSGALIQLDPGSYVAALDGAKAQLAQAQENLNKANSGPRSQEIAAQQALVAAARAQYEQALDNLERQTELYDKDVAPEISVVAARKQAEAAEAALSAQESVLDSLNEGSRTEDIASAKASVALAQSSVDNAKLALGRTAINVPFDAIVSDLMVEVGTFVGPGTPLVEVVSDSSPEVWFNLPEHQIGDIAPGAIVELVFDSIPDAVIPGSVISISPLADSKSRQFPLRVEIDDMRPKPGMAVNGRILTAEPAKMLAVKRDAIVLASLGETLFVMKPPAADAKPFMEGMPPLPTVEAIVIVSHDSIGDMVTISGPVAVGMMVVTRGNESLYSGASIIPTNLMGEGGMGPPPGAEGSPGADPDAAGQAAGGENNDPVEDSEGKGDSQPGATQ